MVAEEQRSESRSLNATKCFYCVVQNTVLIRVTCFQKLSHEISIVSALTKTLLVSSSYVFFMLTLFMARNVQFITHFIKKNSRLNYIKWAEMCGRMAIPVGLYLLVKLKLALNKNFKIKNMLKTKCTISSVPLSLM